MPARSTGFDALAALLVYPGEHGAAVWAGAESRPYGLINSPPPLGGRERVGGTGAGGARTHAESRPYGAGGGEEGAASLADAAGRVALWCPAAAAAARAFADLVQPQSATELEELYTRTFDLTPACSLEVGWHLYGEQYERGAFLVHMRALLARLGLPEGTELPDHLPGLLRALGRLTGEEADRFAGWVLAPAVEKIRAGLGDRDPCGVQMADCGLNPTPEGLTRRRGDAETRSSSPDVPLRDSATPRDTLRNPPSPNPYAQALAAVAAALDALHEKVPAPDLRGRAGVGFSEHRSEDAERGCHDCRC